MEDFLRISINMMDALCAQLSFMHPSIFSLFRQLLEFC